MVDDGNFTIEKSNMMHQANVSKKYYIIGNPVKHSISPYLYRSLEKLKGIVVSYEALTVKESELRNVVRSLKNPEVGGFNVTIPHKTKVLPLLDEVDDLARNIGAVNTVVNMEDQLKGYNTDAIGFSSALRDYAGSSFGRVVVLGAGGAARAATYQLLNIVDKITLFSTNGVSAIKLAKDFEGIGPILRGYRIDHHILEECLSEANLLVNASPIGMSPKTEDIPVPANLIKKNTVVFDMVYYPIETRLLKEAKKIGCPTVDGLWMLVYQALENCRLWFSFTPDVNSLRSIAESILRRDQQ